MIKTVWQIAKLVPVVVAVEDCLYGPASVHGRSMQPTFNPEPAPGHDLVLADKWSIKLYRYNRGDVVLLRCTFPGPIWPTDKFERANICKPGPTGIRADLILAESTVLWACMQIS